MDIDDIFNMPAGQAIGALTRKAVAVPERERLRREYDVREHPVMDRKRYPDIVKSVGVEHVTRVPVDLMKVTARRMTELMCGIPIKREYSPTTEREQEVARVMETIYERTRNDAANVERLNMLFAGCEVATLWYAVEESNDLYGVRSPLKLRCRNFSPMVGDELFPLFDETGDMQAMSFRYSRTVDGRTVQYFDAYSKNRHIKWNITDGYELLEDERTTLGRIPAIYMWRPSPIWEDNAPIVYEMEWALSRNGNYLRRNAKPIFAISSDEAISYGNEKDGDSEFRSILQLPSGAVAGYVTWEQAVENLRYYVQALRETYFSTLQMPDFSMDNMKTSPMSGEARKMVFLDAQLKVQDESGRVLEFLDREVNVVKSFMSIMMPGYGPDIERLQVRTVITPYRIQDARDEVETLLTANGGRPIMSQRESIEAYGRTADVEGTMRQIAEEAALEAGAMMRI